MVTANKVKSTIGRHLLADGMDIVVDFTRSRGSWLVDARNGDRYLDCFSMFASMAVGFNHDALLARAEHFGKLAIQKPANSDCYSIAMAEFIETFSRVAIPDYLPHAFFIEGGALAVENALKAAFDWKVKKNFANGSQTETGQRIIHFRQAFHGRSGYTLSLTNTADPRKTAYFPTFNWPRITTPKLSFPLNAKRLERTKELEARALDEIQSHLQQDPTGIAAIIIEPIQGEGGDNHFRDEFFIELRRICDDHELLLIMDEVQTGVGLTGRFWAHQHFSAQPDIITFGKKTQVCGILASKRIDEVPDNVFVESSRINSTFGGNLIDMVRCDEILQIIERDQLVENACYRGKELLEGLKRLEANYPHIINNSRGRGLMCAFDLEDGGKRNQFREKLLQERLLVIGCGDRSIRFRPHLIISAEEIRQVLHILEKAIKSIEGKS